ncbi:MAG: hypothetical protein WCX71_01075 [Candidatus Buchananbacteria bacterium]
MPMEFNWQVPSWLAIGDQPQSPEDIDWLSQNGIKAIISLAPLKPGLVRKIETAGFDWLSLEKPPKQKNAALTQVKELNTFIREKIAENKPVFICGENSKQPASLVAKTQFN